MKELVVYGVKNKNAILFFEAEEDAIIASRDSGGKVFLNAAKVYDDVDEFYYYSNIRDFIDRSFNFVDIEKTEIFGLFNEELGLIRNDESRFAPGFILFNNVEAAESFRSEVNVETEVLPLKIFRNIEEYKIAKEDAKQIANVDLGEYLELEEYANEVASAEVEPLKSLEARNR